MKRKERSHLGKRIIIRSKRKIFDILTEFVVGLQRGRWLSRINFLLNDLYLDSREYYGAELREWAIGDPRSLRGLCRKIGHCLEKKEKERKIHELRSTFVLHFQFLRIANSISILLDQKRIYIRKNLYSINCPDILITFSLCTNTSRGKFLEEAARRERKKPWVRLPWGWFEMMTGKTIGSARRGIHSSRIPIRYRPSWTWLFPSCRFYLLPRDQSLSMALVVAVGRGICWFTGGGGGFEYNKRNKRAGRTVAKSIEFTSRWMVCSTDSNR